MCGRRSLRRVQEVDALNTGIGEVKIRERSCGRALATGYLGTTGAGPCFTLTRWAAISGDQRNSRGELL